MSSGSSDSESTSECKFETTLESDKESIRGLNNFKWIKWLRWYKEFLIDKKKVCFKKIIPIF